MFLYILEKVTKNESKNKVKTFLFLLYLSVFRRGKTVVWVWTKEKKEIYFLKYNRQSSIVFVRTTQVRVTERTCLLFFTSNSPVTTLVYRFGKPYKKKYKGKGLNCKKTHRVWAHFNETICTYNFVLLN